MSTWLADIGCSAATVALFRTKEINGRGLFDFVEEDKYGFRTEDKLAWFGLKNRDDINIIASHLVAAPEYHRC